MPLGRGLSRGLRLGHGIGLSLGREGFGLGLGLSPCLGLCPGHGLCLCLERLEVNLARLGEGNEDEQVNPSLV